MPGLKTEDLLIQVEKQLGNLGNNQNDGNLMNFMRSSGASQVDMRSIQTSFRNIFSNIQRLQNDLRAANTSIQVLKDTMENGIDDHIIEGLDVTATEPPGLYVDISPGRGIVKGKIYEILNTKQINVPLDGSTKTVYINLFNNGLEASTIKDPEKLPIAKIDVWDPRASAIQDDKPEDGFNAYIISGKDILFDSEQELDDESIAQFRNIMDELLSENLIGNIRLSEDLKIINTQGSLEMDSKEIRLLYPNGAIGAKLNKLGTFFFNEDGVEQARFAQGEAKISNIEITSTGIKLTNGADILIQDNGFIKIDSGAGASTLIDASRIFIGQSTGLSTTLSGATSGGETSITVPSTTNFATSGFLTIDGIDIIKYSSITATTFDGIPESGAYGVTAHSGGVSILQGQGIDLANADGTKIYIDINGVDGQFIKPASIRTNAFSVEDFFLDDADWNTSVAGTMKWGTPTLTYLGTPYTINEASQTTKNFVLWSPTSQTSGLTGGTGNGFYETDTLPDTLLTNQFVVARLVSTAPYYVLMISSTVISGDYITTGLINAAEVDADIITVGTLDVARIAANSLAAEKLDINSMGMNSNIEFTATDLDTVAWGTGTLIFADSSKNSGTIVAGNTGNMGAITYIYYDENVSTTVLQTTTTYANAVDDGKVLMAICEPQAAGKAVITTNRVGTTISGNSIVTGILSANLVTIESTDGKMTLGGNVLTIKDGSDVDQVILGKYDGVNYGLEAGAGNVIINDDGIIVDDGGGQSTSKVQLQSASGLWFFDSGDTRSVKAWVTFDGSDPVFTLFNTLVDYLKLNTMDIMLNSSKGVFWQGATSNNQTGIFADGNSEELIIKMQGANKAFYPFVDGDDYLGKSTNKWARIYSDAYYVGTTAGANFGPGAITNLTVVNGIVTAAS